MLCLELYSRGIYAEILSDTFYRNHISHTIRTENTLLYNVSDHIHTHRL